MKTLTKGSHRSDDVFQMICNIDLVCRLVRDRYNDNKLWLVRRYASGHYSLQQIIVEGDISSVSKVVRMPKKYILNLVDSDIVESMKREVMA